MATLTNTKIKDTYVGLLKTTDNQAIDASGVTLVEDGAGNASALSVGRSGNGVSISGNLAVDTNTLYVDAANNRVGIGITPSLFGVRLHTYNNSTNAYNIFESSTNKWAFGEASGVCQVGGLYGVHTGISVDTSNNVGINNTSPAEKLDVNGSIKLTGYSKFYYSTNHYGSIWANSEGLNIDTIANRNMIFKKAGSEIMRIDLNGRVGIGTSSPSEKLQVLGKGVFGSDGTGSYVIATTNNDQGNARIRMINTGAGGMTFDLVSGLNGVSNAGWSVYDATNGATRMYIDSSGNVGINSTPQNFRLDVNGHYNASTGTAGTDGTGDVYRSGIGWGSTAQPTNVLSSLITTINDGNYGGHITLSNRPSGGGNLVERMRITSGGDLLIGKIVTTFTTDGARLSSTGGNISRTSGTVFDINRNGTDGNVVAFYKAGVNVGTISVTGSSTAYNTSSDYRLKENVVEMTGALDRVDALKPSRFNFIAEPNKTVDGFLAHEVQAIVPEAVTGEKDAVDEEGNPIYQGIDQSKLTPLLTAALKEAHALIKSLEARIEILENK